MSSTKNDITGDSLVSKASTESYRNGWDNTFKKIKEKDEKLMQVDVNTEEDTQRSEDMEQSDEWVCECCGGPMYKQAHWNYGQCDDCGARQDLIDDEYI
jgi:hypothetical protein